MRREEARAGGSMKIKPNFIVLQGLIARRRPHFPFLASVVPVYFFLFGNRKPYLSTFISLAVREMNARRSSSAEEEGLLQVLPNGVLSMLDALI